MPSIELAGGTTTGRDHRKGIPRNRQDAYRLAQTRAGMTALVADGCGSGSDSEVGATIAVRLATTYIHRYLAHGYKPSPALLRRVGQTLLSHISILAEDMGDSLPEVVNSHFLFTLGGAIITEETSLFFFSGDGVVIVNGETTVLDSGPNNTPIYLGYALTGSTLTDDDPSQLDFRVVRQLPTTELSHFLVGTDGVQDVIRRTTDCLPGSDQVIGPISRFWEQDRFFGKGAPVAITRRLNLMARDWLHQTATGRQAIDSGLLPDDTTIVVGRQLHTQEE